MHTNILQIVVGLSAVALTTIAVAFLVAPTSWSILKILLLLAGVVAILNVYIVLFARLFARNPASVVIAMLGQPRCGKTVYLTVLFREMMSYVGGIKFRPYGVETIERITRDIGLLQSGQWLPRTAAELVFPYRAQAALGRGILQRRYKIEMADYAGEHIGELDPSDDERWLHRTEYFRFAIDSDAVLLAADCEAIAKEDNRRIQDAERALLAALQVLMEGKGVETGRRLQAPVALLFLKADLLSSPAVALQRGVQAFERLCRFAGANCAHFRAFAVSAVGATADGDRPPSMLHPVGVVEPMIWILDNLRGRVRDMFELPSSPRKR